MCVGVRICMYVCMFICILCVYVYMYICMNCMCVCVCVCICTYGYVYVCIYIYVYMYCICSIYVYIYIYIYTYFFIRFAVQYLLTFHSSLLYYNSICWCWTASRNVYFELTQENFLSFSQNKFAYLYIWKLWRKTA